VVALGERPTDRRLRVDASERGDGVDVGDGGATVAIHMTNRSDED
jgi:hypothetical protein